MLLLSLNLYSKDKGKTPPTPNRPPPHYELPINTHIIYLIGLGFFYGMFIIKKKN